MQWRCVSLRDCKTNDEDDDVDDDVEALLITDCQWLNVSMDDADVSAGNLDQQW